MPQITIGIDNKFCYTERKYDSLDFIRKITWLGGETKMENNDFMVDLRLHFTEEDLCILLKRIPEPLCLLSGNEHHQPERFIYVNDKAEKLLQMSREELCTYTWEDVFGIPKDANFEEVQEEYKDKTYEHKQSPLEKNLKGHALKVSLQDIALANGKTYFALTIIDSTEHVKTKEQLRQASSEFESLFKYNPNIVYAISMDGLFTNFNDAGLERLGYTRDEILGMSFKEVLVPEDTERTYAHFVEVLKGHVQHFYIQIMDKEKRAFHVEITAVPIILDGEVKGVIGTAQDISQRIKMESKLRESEESHRAFFDYNVDPVITYDLEGNFLTFNKATEDILGAKPEELVGVPFIPFIDEELQEETWHNFQKVREGKPVQYETAVTPESGEQIHLHITLIPAYINGVLTYIHCIGKDITYRKRHDEMMRYMAYHDNLTSLGNQRLFNEELRQLINDSKQNEFALWIVDLDRFKFINDHLGHEAGDQLLSSFAERIQRVIGDRGKIYRYGGDEFAVLTPHMDELRTKLLATEVMHELSKPFDTEEFKTILTASLGISFYPRHGVNEKSLVRAADHAMYHAKKHGRNAFQLYNTDIEGLAHSDLRMENLLHNALENDEFILYYQPQICANKNKIHGIEALIRWNNPELGIVPPVSFIPIAEETGMIVPIGEWVIWEACRQNVEWQKQGMEPIPVSVNLSLRQFYQSDLTSKIKSILTSTGLKPEYLMLEITETIAMQEDIAADVLKELKALGIKIAMDDFGTGYSSLRYLQNFSIDHIKIDKAFTDQLHTKEGRAIITTIISLGKNLDMKVVAEGVETPAQVRELKELGCDVFQGYYFSRPLPAEELQSKLLPSKKS